MTALCELLDAGPVLHNLLTARLVLQALLTARPFLQELLLVRPVLKELSTNGLLGTADCWASSQGADDC